MNLYAWGTKWGIPQAAIDELRAETLEHTVARGGAKSEAGVTARVRLEYAARGDVLFRNNVGAMQDDSGRVVRFGLCNESKAINKVNKSSDLIGITRVQISPGMIGQVVGIFTAIECKAPGWEYSGNEHETAQRHFGEQVVMARGGIFKFIS